MSALASRSAIVVLGRVVRTNASEEPLLAANNATVVVRITRMFAGTEFAGDQVGRTATVILNKPGTLKVGAEALFFGNPRFIGKTLTIADVGELPAPRIKAGVIPPGLAQGIETRRDAPIRLRLAHAAVVFRGTVEAVRPLEAVEGEKWGEPASEHDPQWRLAVLHVVRPLRAVKEGEVVSVIFPASRDIVWFNSPKLKPGDEVLVLAHQPQKEELRYLREPEVLKRIKEQHVLAVSQPQDVLPVQDERRLLRLLQKTEVQP